MIEDLPIYLDRRNRSPVMLSCEKSLSVPLMMNIIKNFLIAVATLVVLLMVFYGILMVIEWGMRVRSRNREQEGLTRLWSAAQKQALRAPEDDEGKNAGV